ncbi:unnamed protein product [Malus baccata var. baccata]
MVGVLTGNFSSSSYYPVNFSPYNSVNKVIIITSELHFFRLKVKMLISFVFSRLMHGHLLEARKWLGITSEALAGTRARGESMPEDLQVELEYLSSPKDHLEFTIVQESIQRKLENVCDSVQVEPKKAIRKFPRVQHLYAKLAGRLRSEDDESSSLWISNRGGTGFNCGNRTFSRRQILSIHKMLSEVFDRGMYAGPVGWFGGGESEFAVGIRSALVKKGLSAMIYAGTGVVEGSNASLEWDELELKISQFTKLLKLEVPLEIKS